MHYKQKSYLLLCHTNINPIIQISITMTTELTTPAMIGIGGPADDRLFFSKYSKSDMINDQCCYTINKGTCKCATKTD